MASATARCLPTPPGPRVCDFDVAWQSVGSVDYFTSHEGLVLEYEEAVTQKVGNAYYNTGAHFLWIGALAVCR